MKTITKTLGFTAIFALLTIVIVSQITARTGDGSLSSSGSIVKSARNLAGFSGISASGGIDIYLTQGTSEKVEVEAEEKVIGKIITEVKDKVLCVYPESGLHHMKAVKVYVTFKEMKSIRASGGSDIYAENLLNLPELSAEMTGGSDLKMTLKTGKLTCALTGGSDADLKGSATECKITATGGSDVKAREMTLENCTASVTGGSDGHFTVNGQADITASGGSDVTLYGSPKVLNRNISGGSDIYIK